MSNDERGEGRVSRPIGGDSDTGPVYGSTTWIWSVPDSAIPNACHSIKCEVTANGGLRLIPLDALGALYLMQFGHGEVRVTWDHQGGETDKNGPQHNLVAVVLRSDVPPLLSRGGSPYWTGMSLSAEEAAACRVFVDEMREKARAARKTEKAAPKKKAKKAKATR